jgi:putative inorganic carbon (hco3(-)) transporter
MSVTTGLARPEGTGFWVMLAPAAAGLLAAGGAAAAVGMAARADDAAPVVLAAGGLALLWLVLGFLDGRAALYGVFASFPLASLAGAGFLGLEPVELAVLTASMLIVMRRLALGRSPLPWTPALYWAVALLCWMLISFLSSVDVGRSVKELVAFAGGLLLASVALDVASNVPRLRHLLAAFVLVALGISAAALASASDLQAVEGGTIITGRPAAIFSQPNEFGLFATMAILVAVGLAFGARTRLGSSASALALVPLAMALLLTASRGAWLGLGAGLVVLLAALPRARGGLIAVLFALIVLVGTSPSWAPGASGRAIELRFESFFERSTQDVRPSEWAEGLRQLRDDPLTGQGPGAFPAASGAPESETRATFPAHAHNLWLEWGAQGGLPAVLLLSGLVAAVSIVAHRAHRRLIADRNHRDAAVTAGVAAALVAVLVHGLVDYPLTNDVLWYTTWLLIGVLLGVCRPAREQPAQSVSSAAA